MMRSPCSTAARGRCARIVSADRREHTTATATPPHQHALAGFWLAVALLALAASCHSLLYDRNAGFCCEDPARCKEYGAPGPIACENASEVCDVVNNRCVPAECSVDQECTDPALAACTRGRCEACPDDLSCARFADAPICAGGTCRACRLGDCPSGVCDTASGACIAESEAAYVAKTGQDNGTCTRSEPCRSIGYGLAQLGARRWLHVAASGEAYTETAAMPGAGVQISGKTVTIIGVGATLTPARNGDSALLIEGASTVVVEGLRIVDAGISGDGVACRNVGPDSPIVTLRSTDVRNNRGRGVNATSCTLTVEASTIAGNESGGVSISGGSATLLNNMIVLNGGFTSVFGGVSIGQITSGSHVLAFNTIAANGGVSGAVTGVACNQVAVPVPLVFSNNIVYGNQVTGGGTQVGGNNCSYTYSDIGPQTVAGIGNINMDPLFVDAMTANFHLRAGSPAKNAADPSAMLRIDIDGDARPQGDRSDMGADEVVE